MKDTALSISVTREAGTTMAQHGTRRPGRAGEGPGGAARPAPLPLRTRHRVPPPRPATADPPPPCAPAASPCGTLRTAELTALRTTSAAARHRLPGQVPKQTHRSPGNSSPPHQHPRPRCFSEREDVMENASPTPPTSPPPPLQPPAPKLLRGFNLGCLQGSRCVSRRHLSAAGDTALPEPQTPGKCRCPLASPVNLVRGSPKRSARSCNAPRQQHNRQHR
ncbi:serine/arginine repetitive matrix protein 1-like [Columba livia]|uniref:serine/arginine repetitive matrix protein 1-like n=1 Tax=Columba livia TaxID=8932 RepID=UPI0031BA4B55